ncbi:hypothetical protein EHQ58_12290 [Leptospira ognonensis]|uniref:Uncharacterized protein n=1 Tax=Leptospira ognonensis TaxID=2484945 RepID=A0A4V3JR17_9LEPT|nr:hypothetical protein [Leptospira ognonensis]TGL58153.1 hypothetical protein EHQ58_12290 [Leptospira ognonensis]
MAAGSYQRIDIRQLVLSANEGASESKVEEASLFTFRPGYPLQSLLSQRISAAILCAGSDFYFSIHHTALFNTYDCITVGWLNPVLHKWKFSVCIRFLAEKTIGKWAVLTKGSRGKWI